MLKFLSQPLREGLLASFTGGKTGPQRKGDFIKAVKLT
jgi:hypothetical protein